MAYQNNNFEYDLMVGQIKERELANILENEKIEVKSCTEAKYNVFVEYYNTKTKTPSGICTTKAKYYAFILANNKIILIKTEELEELIRVKGYKPVLGCDKNMGYSVPITDIIRIEG